MRPKWDALRDTYKPEQIAVLFVGEAPPANGTFFYTADSQVYRYLKAALASHLGADENFLGSFQAHGYFLDDLVQEPVDHLLPAQRRPIFEQSIPRLTSRIREYKPRIIVTILKRIAPYVLKAIDVAKVEVVHHAVPFPGTGQQGNFRRAMTEIVKQLP